MKIQRFTMPGPMFAMASFLSFLIDFQPQCFLVFYPGHENYSRLPSSFVLRHDFVVMASLSSGRLAITRPPPLLTRPPGLRFCRLLWFTRFAGRPALLAPRTRHLACLSKIPLCVWLLFRRNDGLGSEPLRPLLHQERPVLAPRCSGFV